MMGGAKRAAIAGVGTALSLLFVYLASVMPVNHLSLIAAAGFVTAAVVAISGASNALLSFIAASVLCWLLVPQKQYALYYLVFFGWYGVAKVYFESKFNPFLQWVFKIVVFNAAAIVIFFMGTAFVSIAILQKLPLPVIWAAANIAFVLYDYVFGMIQNEIKKRI